MDQARTVPGADGVLADVAAWLLAEAPGACWIAVDGLGAAGKSSLAAAMASVDPRVVVVSLDDFTRPGSVGWEKQRFVEQVWRPLRQGHAARYQRWHWTDAAPGEWVEVAPGSVVVVEGIGAGDAPTEVAWDRLVWVAAPSVARTSRAERRDPGRFECWSQTWRPIEDEWFAAHEPWRRADLVWVNAGCHR